MSVQKQQTMDHWAFQHSNTIVELVSGHEKTAHAPDLSADDPRPRCGQKKKKTCKWRAVGYQKVAGWRDLCSNDKCVQYLEEVTADAV